ncbi:MAG TPA: sirohydrochlorin chelatase [Kineosporiaceae bacterium]|nr:sirohydrochlorin chelatase [Kineosporiaceae bacterium]
MTARPLVAVAHGSRDPAGQHAVEALLDVVRGRRPDLAVDAAYVQNAPPPLADVLAARGTGAVVVPLLLSHGYHVAVDVALAAAAAEAVVTPPLGPHPGLADALDARLTQAGVPPRAPVVLAAAGSSDPAAGEDVTEQARLLADRRGGPVTAAYASAGTARVDDAVADLLRRYARPVAVAPYLLAPGSFAARIRQAAATWVADPIGAHPAVADLVLERYLAAARIAR